MKGDSMKLKMIFSGLLMLISLSAFAQPRAEMEERIQSMHAAYVTDRLRLTAEESQSFWPVYNEYKDKEKAVKKAYKSGRSTDGVSEAEASKMIDDHLLMEEELLQLKQEYFTRLRALVPAQKLVLLPAAEREFKERLIREMQQRRQERRGARKGG